MREVVVSLILEGRMFLSAKIVGTGLMTVSTSHVGMSSRRLFLEGMLPTIIHLNSLLIFQTKRIAKMTITKRA